MRAALTVAMVIAIVVVLSVAGIVATDRTLLSARSTSFAGRDTESSRPNGGVDTDRPLEVARRLYDIGVPLLRLSPGRKSPIDLGWADPAFDTPWPEIESHLRAGGNVGVRSGPAPRLPPALGTATIWVDDDLGHIAEDHRTDEIRERSDRIHEFAERWAFLGADTPTGGYRYGFCSRSLFESDGHAIKMLTGNGSDPYAVEVYCLGPDGGCRNSVVPPSALDPAREPPKPGRSYVHPDYELLWFREPRPGDLDGHIDEFRSLFDRLRPWTPNDRAEDNAPPAELPPVTGDVALVLDRVRALPHGRLYEWILRNRPRTEWTDRDRTTPAVIGTLVLAGADDSVIERFHVHRSRTKCTHWRWYADHARAKVREGRRGAQRKLETLVGIQDFRVAIREVLRSLGRDTTDIDTTPDDPALHLRAWSEHIRGERAATLRPVLWNEKVKPDGTKDLAPNRAAFEDLLLAERWFVSLRDSRELRVYDPKHGYYVMEADTYIAEYVRSEFAKVRKTASTHFVNEVVATVRDRSYHDRTEINPPWCVVVGNGVLNVKTRALGKHSPVPIFTFGIPVRYNPGAKCPTFDAFLTRALPDVNEQLVVLEFAGYFLWPGQPLRRFLVMWGPTTTGKSTFTAVLIGVYGRENISAVDLAELADHRFMGAELVDRLANIRSDISGKKLRNPGKIQELTGGKDEVTGERKYQRPFKVIPGAKIVLSGNRLPPVEGATSAFWIRVLMTLWTASIPKKLDKMDYSEVLLGEAEGIFARFVEGSARLLKQGGFTGLSVDVADKWLRSSDPAFWVATNEFKDDPDGEVELDTILERVDQVAEEENLTEDLDLPTPRSVASAIRRAHPRVVAMRKMVRGVKATVYCGISATATSPGAPTSPSKPEGPNNKPTTPPSGSPEGISPDVAPPPIPEVKGMATVTSPSQLTPDISVPTPSAGERGNDEGKLRGPRVHVRESTDEEPPGRHISRSTEEPESGSPAQQPNPRVEAAIAIARAIYQATPSTPITSDRVIGDLEQQGFSEAEADRAFGGLAATELRHVSGDFYLLKTSREGGL